jgi:predicted ATPase/class 3 adenylate cyclase
MHFALVFTDLVDSTAVNARVGDDRMADVWAAHEAGSRNLLRVWKGREVERSDGLVALFESAVDAAGFVQQYHALTQALPVPLFARVSVHVGALHVVHRTTEDIAVGARALDVFGLAKAHCARLMSLAGGGQTLASLEAAEALQTEGVVCESHGHWRLKGIDQTAEIFEVLHYGQLARPLVDTDKAFRVVNLAGVWTAVRAVPRFLPAEPPGFFGRTAELNRLVSRDGAGHRVVTLVGPGGVGKTRLAVRHAWGWLGNYPGGAYFCDLSSVRHGDGIAATVARALNVPVGSDPAAQLARAIHGLGRCLIVLDNAEQVVVQVAQTVRGWAQQAPDARFLITSRERLGLSGELVIELAPLCDDDACELFRYRAKSVGAGDWSAADEKAVVPLAQMLDGLPLALELAASRTLLAGPARLLEWMSDRFRLLVSRAGAPIRQASLISTLEWSWELLAEPERGVLAQLSVFEGSFSLRALEGLVDLSAWEPNPWLIDVMQSLVDKSLVQRAGPTRYRLLGCIREFASAKLDDAVVHNPSQPRLRQRAETRHARHFASLDEDTVVAEGSVDLDNICAACRRATDCSEFAIANDALQLAWALLRRVGPYRVAIELAERLVAQPNLPAEVRTTGHWVAGAAHFACGDSARAEGALRQAADSAAIEMAASIHARIHTSLGEVLSVRGDAPGATAELAQARHYADLDGSAVLRCQVLNALGAMAHDAGHIADARGLFTQALEVADAGGSRRWQAALLANMTALELADGHHHDALDFGRRALAAAETAADLRWAGNAHCNVGLSLLEIARVDEARGHFQQAVHIARQTGHRALECIAQCNLGLACERAGELEAALHHHQSALTEAASLGDLRIEAQLGACLGSVLARLGRHDEARSCLQGAIDRLSRMDDPLTLGLLWCAVAENESHSGIAGAPDVEHALHNASLCAGAAGVSAESELGRRLAEVEAISRG